MQLLLGDFNMDTPTATKLTAKLGAGLQQAKGSNSADSRYNKATLKRIIDHIFYVGLNSRPNWCTENRFLYLYDHMSITAQWNIDSLEAPKKSARLSVKKILLAGDKFTSNNRIEALADANIALDELCDGLTDAFLAQSAHIVSNGPVYDLDKNLITENQNKLEVWNQHFSDLAKDTTGNSRDPSKWQVLLSDDSDYYPECDQSISWADITTALNDTRNNKAPGADGVPNGEHPEIHDDKRGGACAQEGRHE
ncbi:hypothetical protein AYI70_g8097 [Smittium culicis]|uniref:Endonuclease/exonuclease/phosphatase domain-containing protein n=1 Tax=Smittium culicis TaxID=133412 RepID=A0A1R1XHJ0_9FUNG|nr:hypothetical protein AYI70_g8097 [Smittium culicis]